MAATVVTVFLGRVPRGEKPATPTDEADAWTQNSRECLAFLWQVERCYGTPPPGAWLTIDSKSPSERAPIEVVAKFYDRGFSADEAQRALLWMDTVRRDAEGLLEFWDEESQRRLGLLPAQAPTMTP
jgi:hypothetical protein